MDQHKHDIALVIILLFIISIGLTILLAYRANADTPFDSIEYGVSVNITSPPPDCPHAMLISPINNSIVDTRDVDLTVYVYDNDDTIWFLTTTFYDYSTNTSISELTSRTEYNISTTWTNRTPGETYRWYAFVDNSTGNYTSGIFSFTVTTDLISGASDFYGTWILLALVFMLLIITVIFKSGLLAIFTGILTSVITYTYSTSLMDPNILFDEMMLYIFIFITIFIWLNLFYIILWKK